MTITVKLMTHSHHARATKRMKMAGGEVREGSEVIPPSNEREFVVTDVQSLRIDELSKEEVEKLVGGQEIG